MRCDIYNEMQGTLAGVDCPICKNKGYVALVRGGTDVHRECECVEGRRSQQRMRKSGLSTLALCTFENYQVDGAWQRTIMEAAKRYLQDYSGHWFFMGGQVGCGKTHICSAIVQGFLQKGFAAKYMLWRDEVVQLRALIMNEGLYRKTIQAFKSIPVLYIDDFFKTEKGKTPTTAEVNIAFEILNYRYNQPECITLLSSEYCIDHLLEIDEAVGSRIFQRTKHYCLCIDEDRSKNYRLN